MAVAEIVVYVMVMGEQGSLPDKALLATSEACNIGCVWNGDQCLSQASRS
jgi:hypothetical protein